MIYLYSLGAANGLVLSVLLCFHSRATSASKVLGLWCLLLSLNFLGYFLYVDNQINSISFLIGWSYFLPAAYGGLLYLYCLKLCNQQPIKWVDSVHLIPLILCYLLNFDILMAPAEQKLAYISTLPPQTPSFFVSQFVLYAQAFFYGVLSIGVLFKYKRQVKEQYSNIKGSLTLWLKVLIGITLTIWLVKLIPSLMGTGFWLSEVGSVLIVVLIYSIGYVHWSNPHLFKVDEVIEFHELSNEFNADAGQNQKLLRDTNKVGSRLALDLSLIHI